MSEIALTQTDQSAGTCDMYIAGYYLANETLDDLRYVIREIYTIVSRTLKKLSMLSYFWFPLGQTVKVYDYCMGGSNEYDLNVF